MGYSSSSLLAAAFAASEVARGLSPELCSGRRIQPRAIGLVNHMLDKPSDLKFRPGKDGSELWVSNMGSSDFTVFRGLDQDLSQVTFEKVEDTLKMHYSVHVSSFDFSNDGEWLSTCQDSYNNYLVPWFGGNGFMGPSLYKSDDIGDVNSEFLWGKVDGKALYGSHYDMNHEAPFCMGLTLDKDRQFWAFNGHKGYINWFDFDEDHGAGGSDHSKAHVRAYTDVKVTRVEGIPSHLVYDHARSVLYVADTGGDRVLRVDMNQASDKGDMPSPWPERLLSFREYTIAEGGVKEFSGIKRPSGLALANDGDTLLVSSADSGAIFVLNAETGDVAEGLSKIETGAKQIGALALHPTSGHILYTDLADSTVARLECVANDAQSLPGLAPPLAGVPRMRYVGGTDECSSIAVKALRRKEFQGKARLAFFEMFDNSGDMKDLVSRLNAEHAELPENVEIVWVNDYRLGSNEAALKGLADFPIVQASFGALVTIQVFPDVKQSSDIPQSAFVVYDRNGYVVRTKLQHNSEDLDEIFKPEFLASVASGAQCGCPESKDVTVAWDSLDEESSKISAHEGSVLRFDVDVDVHMDDSEVPVTVIQGSDHVVPAGASTIEFRPEVSGKAVEKYTVTVVPCGAQVPAPTPAPSEASAPTPAPTDEPNSCGNAERIYFRKPQKFGGKVEKVGKRADSCACAVDCIDKDADFFTFHVKRGLCSCLTKEDKSRVRRKSSKKHVSGQLD